MRRQLIAPIILLVTILGTGYGAASLEHPNLGSHASGPALSPSDLNGHVVLFEYWGIHCGPCLASIPHLVELQEKFGRENFIVIANQCQGADDATAKSTWLSHGGNEHVSVINGGGLSGANVSGIPHCFLFNHEGKLIYDGHPGELGNKVEEAVRLSPGALVVGHTYTKTAKYAQQIGAQKSNLAACLKALRGLAAGADAVTKEEASFLLHRVETFATDQMASVSKERTEDPIAATNDLMHLLALLKGDELGKPCEALIAELKNDKAFQTELKADVMLADIQARAGKAGLGSGNQPSRSAVIEIGEGIKALVQRFPDTIAAAKSKKLAEEWHL